MRQRFQLLFQFFLFTGNQTGFRQLLQLETNIILFLSVLVGFLRHFPQFPFQRLVTPELLTIQNQQDLVLCHYIDHFQLKTVIPQQQVLMLRVDIDQTAA